MAAQANQSELLALTSNIVSAHVSNNETADAELLKLIRDVYDAVASLGRLRNAVKYYEGGEAGAAGAGRSDQEVGNSRFRGLPGRRQEAQDAQASSENRL